MSLFRINQKGQTSFEAIIVTGAVIVFSSVLLATYYFSDVSQQTTAIIILKTEMLNELNKLQGKYVIVSSLEPMLTETETLCFSVKTSPLVTNPEDSAAITSVLPGIIAKISAKTKYPDVEIKFNNGDCS